MQVTAALDRANDEFHEAYDDAEKGAELGTPVFILFADLLVVHRGKKSNVFHVTPKSFHAVKSAVHVAVAVYILLRENTERATLDAKTTSRARQLRERAVGSRRDLEAEDALNVDASATLLRDSVTFLDRALEERRISSAALRRFAVASGKQIEPLMDLAAKLELDRLHRTVEEAISTLTPEERHTFQVVVAGRHQARDRSLPMQYFQKRLDVEAGGDDRLVYAEGASTVEEALAIIGKQRIDRELAEAFFGDSKRMQRDLLGDAAERLLEASDVEPLNDTRARR